MQATIPILLLALLVGALLELIVGAKYRLKFAFCNQAPNPALQLICSQLHQWDSLVRHHTTSTSTMTRSWSSWRTERVWSSSRSRWSASSKTWTSWSEWSSSNIRSWPREHRVLATINETTHTNASEKESKRVAFEIQYEISSGSRPVSGQSHTRTEWFGPIPPMSRQRPGNKDLYRLEQVMIGPPGQRVPNVHMRNAETQAAHAIGSSGLPAQERIYPPSDRIETKERNQPHHVDPVADQQSEPWQTPEETKKGVENALECMDLNCLCPFMHGRLLTSGCQLPSGRRLQMALRKEYRQLSTEERHRFHAAINRLKQLGGYDRIAEWHSDPRNSGGAHSGPAFLPWHREFEIALRLIDDSVSLPYWDSTLDSHIPNATDSALFDERLAGETDQYGQLVNGFASAWHNSKGQRLIRHLGEQGRPLNNDDIATVMRHNDVTGVLAYTAPQQGCRYPMDWSSLEYSHGNALVWLGGLGLQQETAADDPLFFMHHAFVDNIWESWRNQRQNARSRITAYPPDEPECSSGDHFAHSPMRPFQPLRNINGISDSYTTNLYHYAPRPTCHGHDVQCASEFLFCDLSHGHPQCSTKIRVGGNCIGYHRGENPCYQGVCHNDKCVQMESIETVIRATRTVEDAADETENSKKSTDCFNLHECCSIWANAGRCSSESIHMHEWCAPSCQQCSPTYDINDECGDRHPHCAIWATQDECTANPTWMSENCRRACDRCHTQRSVTCRDQ